MKKPCECMKTGLRIVRAIAMMAVAAPVLVPVTLVMFYCSRSGNVQG